MMTPRYACPRCARTFETEGACPHGHGWLLDLEDADDRVELEAIRDMGRERRTVLAHVFELLGIQLGSLTVMGVLLMSGSFESYDALWGTGLIVAIQVGVLLAATLGWLTARFANPRVMRARRIQRALDAAPPSEALARQVAAIHEQARMPEKLAATKVHPSELRVVEGEAGKRTHERRHEQESRRRRQHAGAASIVK